MDKRKALLLDCQTSEFRIRELRANIELSGDNSGSLARALAYEHETVAIGEFVLNGNVSGFRAHMQESARLQYSLHARNHASPGAVFEHFVSTESTIFIFNALASGDFDLAFNLASIYVAEVPDQLKNRFSDLIRNTTRGEAISAVDLSKIENHPFYRNYVLLMKCIGNCGCDAADILRSIDRTHRKDSRSSNGVFAGTAKEHLSVWGIGLGRLAIHAGVLGLGEFSSEFIPLDLLAA